MIHMVPACSNPFHERRTRLFPQLVPSSCSRHAVMAGTTTAVVIAISNRRQDFIRVTIDGEP